MVYELLTPIESSVMKPVLLQSKTIMRRKKNAYKTDLRTLEPYFLDKPVLKKRVYGYCFDIEQIIDHSTQIMRKKYFRNNLRARL